jgi:hypothetical protein
MKQPFRFFRGEFNGKYLYDLVISPNFAVKDITDEFVYNILFTWKLEEEIIRGELAIRHEDIINIAIIAGLFQPRSVSRLSTGSTYFTLSHIVNGKERSERGLMDMETERFRFVRTEHDEYDDDIVNEACVRYRMGLVPEGQPIIGYIPYNVDIYQIDGGIIWENILSSPPSDGSPYIDFYGEKFLVHEEWFKRETPLNIEIFKLLLECVQKIRYNGPTIANFLEVTQILGEGYICDIEILPFDKFYTVLYSLNELSDIIHRDRRHGAWIDICKKKFKLFSLEARI